LSNGLDYACAVSSNGIVDVEDLPDCVARARRGDGWPRVEMPAKAPASSSDGAADLLASLRAHHWNISRVARERGVDRTTIHRQIRRFNLIAPNKLD
jgi:transcriptional regulator of acetoin/glycerol metabolism